MKKMILTACALACASAVIAQTATSANVVGYNKKTTPGAAGLSRNLVGVPFDGTTSVLVSELFGDTLPLNTKVYAYTSGPGGGYAIEAYAEVTGPPPTFIVTTNWTPDTTMVDSRSGMWIELASNAVTTTTIFAGEVADGPIDITIDPLLNLIHYPFAATVLFTDTELTDNPTIGDRVYKWDVSSVPQGYSVINEYSIIIGPPPLFLESTNWTDLGMTLDLGDAFWYLSSNAAPYTVTLNPPYTL